MGQATHLRGLMTAAQGTQENGPRGSGGASSRQSHLSTLTQDHFSPSPACSWGKQENTACLLQREPIPAGGQDKFAESTTRKTEGQEGLRLFRKELESIHPGQGCMAAPGPRSGPAPSSRLLPGPRASAAGQGPTLSWLPPCVAEQSHQGPVWAPVSTRGWEQESAKQKAP